jgi:hypothetical protein
MTNFRTFFFTKLLQICRHWNNCIKCFHGKENISNHLLFDKMSAIVRKRAMLSIAERTAFGGIWLDENELKMQERDSKSRALKF